MSDNSNDRHLRTRSVSRGGRLYSAGCLLGIFLLDVLAKGILCLGLLVMGKRIPGYVQFCGWVTLSLVILIFLSAGAAIVSEKFGKGKGDLGKNNDKKENEQ